MFSLYILKIRLLSGTITVFEAAAYYKCHAELTELFLKINVQFIIIILAKNCYFVRDLFNKYRLYIYKYIKFIFL